MTNEEVLKALESAVSNTISPKVNSASSVFELMMSLDEDKRPWILREAAKIWDDFDGGGVIEPSVCINQVEVQNELQKYGELSDSVLNSLVAQNPEEDEFYEKLLETLNSVVFPSETAKIVALYNILNDSQMPYLHLKSGMQMNDDRYRDIQTNIKDQLKSLRHLLGRRFEQRTEKASHVLDLILSLDTPEERVVLLSRIISLVDKGEEYARRLAMIEKRDS